ncbi:MAG: aminopeptidase P family protein [Acidobacteria bacterium]|nr:aminopeptidase P family protein [Acidobacteriota bacterium]
MSLHSHPIRLRALAVAIFIVLGSILLPGDFKVTADNAKNPILELWRITPSAPQVGEVDRVSELRARRNEVMKRIGNQSIMVLFSADPRVYTGDVDYPYRQENNLYYLTNIKQDATVLVLIPGAKKTREILFIPRRDPYNETWNGRMMSFEEARDRSGVQEVWDKRMLYGFLAFLAPRLEAELNKRGNVSKPSEKLAAQWQEDFQNLVEAIRAEKADLYLLWRSSPRDAREYRQEYDFAEMNKTTSPGLSIKSAHGVFGDLRQLKSEWELRLLQHAVDITSEAFHRVFAITNPGMYEYEVHAEFEYTFRRRNADFWGYPSIVGSGTNATTLHYQTSQDRMPENGLLLMDCGAEFDHYSADITRTIPISGKFTKEQAEIYRIVYQAQIEAIKAVRPGNTMSTRHDPQISANSVHGRAVEVIKDGLLRLGLITSKHSEEYRIWFMHGTSHWLGMNVHDVGESSKPLAPGMVLTVEPGIYIRPDALDVLPKNLETEVFIKAVRPAFEKYKGIGIRIEDDVVVTDTGVKVLSSAIPSKLEEVEAAMAKLRQEYRKSGWPSVAGR